MGTYQVKLFSNCALAIYTKLKKIFFQISYELLHFFLSFWPWFPCLHYTFKLCYRGEFLCMKWDVTQCMRVHKAILLGTETYVYFKSRNNHSLGIKKRSNCSRNAWLEISLQWNNKRRREKQLPLYERSLVWTKYLCKVKISLQASITKWKVEKSGWKVIRDSDNRNKREKNSDKWPKANSNFTYSKF